MVSLELKPTEAIAMSDGIIEHSIILMTLHL